MPIHEKSLIRPENLVTHEHLEIEGVDVSGHWSTFINSRVVTDYNEQMEEEIAALPGGEFIHRCWQCGSCTNSCTVNAINPDFNPRYWIYLIRMGIEEELLRDKDIIWQCVSCNKCTYACPRDVNPEGVMKATAHWLELKGHTEKKPSMMFDEDLLRAGLRHRQDRGRPGVAAVLRAHQAAAVPGLADRDGARLGNAAAGRAVDEARPRHAVSSAHARLGRGERGDRRICRRAQGGRSPVRSGSMRKEPSDERQVQKGRLLPRLRARRHRPRLQPLHQGARQGARP